MTFVTLSGKITLKDLRRTKATQSRNKLKRNIWLDDDSLYSGEESNEQKHII